MRPVAVIAFLSLWSCTPQQGHSLKVEEAKVASVVDTRTVINARYQLTKLDQFHANIPQLQRINFIVSGELASEREGEKAVVSATASQIYYEGPIANGQCEKEMRQCIITLYVANTPGPEQRIFGIITPKDAEESMAASPVPLGTIVQGRLNMYVNLIADHHTTTDGEGRLLAAPTVDVTIQYISPEEVLDRLIPEEEE